MRDYSKKFHWVSKKRYNWSIQFYSYRKTNLNMSKLGNDGKPIYNEKGKVMKGPNYSEPNLKQFIE